MSTTVVEQQPMEEETNTVPEDEAKELANKLRGKPKSGRSWKEPVSRFVFTSRLFDLIQWGNQKSQAKGPQKELESETRRKNKTRTEETVVGQSKTRTTRRKTESQRREKKEDKAKRRKLIKERFLSSGMCPHFPSLIYVQINNTEKVKKMSKKQRKNVMPLQDLKKLQQQPRK